jgi:hypothetical protein
MSVAGIMIAVALGLIAALYVYWMAGGFDRD